MSTRIQKGPSNLLILCVDRASSCRSRSQGAEFVAHDRVCISRPRRPQLAKKSCTIVVSKRFEKAFHISCTQDLEELLLKCTLNKSQPHKNSVCVCVRFLTQVCMNGHQRMKPRLAFNLSTSMCRKTLAIKRCDRIDDCAAASQCLIWIDTAFGNWVWVFRLCGTFFELLRGP